ncbi:MAG: ADP-ribosylglycohydrolase family protein [Gammaproteobacteria bacterium]|nr:ADP-ribosylglycohydrolase family protein [Gammaproteobacteria bacterium]
MALPEGFDERVYAGVLGKIIGVYLGRPFEGWTNERIEAELGEVDYYVHDKVGVPLIVTDDDISGTFTFIRALEDYNFDADITPAQIGQTWLNYLIEERTILWWGGMGNSTEHTAYLRLLHGHRAPDSGSMALNGKVVAEQIGAQIFIDSWAMVAPGDPERAADYARRAGSVSHDGEAIYGAQVLAAMEAQAFVESDIDALIDVGVRQIPGNSVVYGMIQDIRDWHAKNGDDWRATFANIKANYGYDKYGGNCHMVPNHGLIIHSLLHGEGNFQKSLMIVNTSGWDTDCNSGNLGCLLGIRGGLESIDAGPDWRTPVADICFKPSADSGGGISDAVTETRRIVDIAHRLQGIEPPQAKNGARFHFSYPGSVQGFRGHDCVVNNLNDPAGERCLAVHFDPLPDREHARATTATFVDSKETAKYFETRGYSLMASPTLNPGQTVTASVQLTHDATDAVDVALCIRVFDQHDKLVTLHNAATTMEPGATEALSWQIPDLDGYPIAAVGLEILSAPSGGVLYLQQLTWSGAPIVTLKRNPGGMWHRAWVNGVDNYRPFYPEGFRIIQNRGTGLLLYGDRAWTDYRVAADVTPHMIRRTGIAARVQGMRRYYALTLNHENRATLTRELDGTTELASVAFDVALYTTYTLELTVIGDHLVGRIDGADVLEATDDELKGGGIALLVDEGRSATQSVTLSAP